MAEHDELIGILNEALTLEYTAAVQYNQHSMLLTGRDRLTFRLFVLCAFRPGELFALRWRTFRGDALRIEESDSF